MPGGFEVEPGELNKASEDIIGCVGQVQGIDLESLTGDSVSYGHNGVFESLARFCTTWQLAAMLLSERSSSAAQALVGVARNYVNVDDSGGQRMDQLQSNIPPS